MVTGTDLVSAQLQLAADHSLRYSQEQVYMEGWAIEARVLAEDPEDGFLPATGHITHLQTPGGPGVRLDSALYLGMPVTSDYDSLIAKVIAWGEDRSVAIRRLCRALAEFHVGGVPTDIEFLTQILNSSSFVQGRTDTTYLDTFQPLPSDGEEEQAAALTAAILVHQAQSKTAPVKSDTASLWQASAWREQMNGNS
jgi:acetyl/propionyl-CoA carboxylase alpha subunit